MGWFSRRGTDDDQKGSLSSAWNSAAGATVLLPLFLFLMARLVNNIREGGGDGGEGEGGWWWWWQQDRPQEERGTKGALGFVYIWSLIIFALLVWRGDRVLEHKKDHRALFAALVVFANLAFLCCILMVAGLQAVRNMSRQSWLVKYIYGGAPF
jgi:hypothetical protein